MTHTIDHGQDVELEHDDDCDGSCMPDAPDCTEGHTHRWSSKGQGGCDENPGVWSLGGTTLQYRMACKYCGCVRVEVRRGSQRNPFECDTVEYDPE